MEKSICTGDDGFIKKIAINVLFLLCLLSFFPNGEENSNDFPSMACQASS